MRHGNPNRPRLWHRAGVICLVALLAAGTLLLLAPPMPPAESAPDSQCVACHTDAAKLKALTPPDPPHEEEGEG